MTTVKKLKNPDNSPNVPCLFCCKSFPFKHNQGIRGWDLKINLFCRAFGLVEDSFENGLKMSPICSNCVDLMDYIGALLKYLEDMETKLNVQKQKVVDLLMENNPGNYADREAQDDFFSPSRFRREICRRLNIPIPNLERRSEEQIQPNIVEIVENIVLNPEKSHKKLSKKTNSRNYPHQQEDKINHPHNKTIFEEVRVDCAAADDDDNEVVEIIEMKLSPRQFMVETRNSESPTSPNNIYSSGEFADQPTNTNSPKQQPLLICDQQFDNDGSLPNNDSSCFPPNDELPPKSVDPLQEIKFNLPPNIVLKDCFIKLEKLPKSLNAPNLEIFSKPKIKRSGSKNNRILISKKPGISKGERSSSKKIAPRSNTRSHALSFKRTHKPLKKIVKSPNVVKSFQSNSDVCETNFKCKTCGAEFKKKERLKTHKVLVHKEPHPFYCDFDGCNKGFMYSRTLADHKMLHTGDRPFHCDTCNAGYRTKGALHEHKLSHLPKDLSNFICDVCGKTFRSSMHLRLHQRLHTRERKFKCPHCPWAFQQLYHLTRHIAKHSEARAFLCQQCGVAFKYKSTLNNHLKIHKQKQIVRPKGLKGTESTSAIDSATPKKKYRYTIWNRCHHCPLKYIKLCELVQHLVSDHDEQPKFECETCHKTGFVTKSQLTLHKQTHKTAVCPKCKKVYTAKNKKQHLKHCPMMKNTNTTSS